MKNVVHHVKVHVSVVRTAVLVVHQHVQKLVVLVVVHCVLKIVAVGVHSHVIVKHRPELMYLEINNERSG